MKRLGAVLSLALIIVLMASSLCFATSDDFDLIKTSPKDGYSSASVDNFSIKMYFNKPVLNEANQAANKRCITVKDQDGVVLPIEVYYSEKEEGLVMALYKQDDQDKKERTAIKEDCQYTVTISEDFLSADGTPLGETKTIEFKTLNQTQSTSIYMVMMVIMFGAMFYFSSKAMKKEQEKKKAADEKVNPYKKAKETGKSVEEIVAKDQKQKAKRAAAAAKKERKEQQDEEDDEPIVVVNTNKKVKGPRPISAGGSTYITGRKAAAEAARQKGTTNPKNKSKKSKNKK